MHTAAVINHNALIDSSRLSAIVEKATAPSTDKNIQINFVLIKLSIN